MSGLFQDIWQDLLDKRLLPIAIALVVGIVAIPVVLMRPAEQPSTVPAASVSTVPEDPEGGVSLEVADVATGGAGSSLDTLGAKNPFKPPSGLMKAGEGSSTASSAAGAGADSGAGAGETGGGGGTSPGSPPGGTVEPTPPTQRTTEYEYVADVTFWDGNRRRRIRGLRKLDMLPSQASPVLIFMGTTEGGGNAVFLVDSTLKAAGEGNCSPSRSNCAFVNIGPGAEHTFTSDEGDSYRLRVDEIHKVKAGATAAATTPVASTAIGSESVEEANPFDLPSLVDLVVETESGTPSSNAQVGR
jgi:hypothetical protein